MTRFVLFVVLAIFVARAFWRVYDAILEAASGRPPKGQVPDRGVQMVRDPVCGTFLLPERAVMLTDGHDRVFFCSDTCRDKYRSRTA